jgi:hypothetical protein
LLLVPEPFKIDNSDILGYIGEIGSSDTGATRGGGGERSNGSQRASWKVDGSSAELHGDIK